MLLDKIERVYVAGCGGMLGLSVYHELLSAGVSVKATDIDCNEPWLEFADVKDYEMMLQSIADFKPDLIINLAALTDLEYCETNPDDAWLTNAMGAENLGLIANKLDVTYVYISTAGIFDGLQEYYNDFDRPNPLSIYAKSKFYGETYVLSTVKKHFVLRAGWMMGGGPTKDKKFINKLYRQICDGKNEIFVVQDKLGTPTYTKDFAVGLINLVIHGQFGLYNQVCSGDASRRDVAEEFIRLLGVSEKIKLTTVDSSFFEQAYFAPRPASEKLINLKLNSRNLNVMRHWKGCLEEYVNDFYMSDYKNRR
jgi:dTDP-4-dehydrorhamnose reductase